MSELKTYIGVKRIQAEPKERDGKPGYRVVYEPDGYEGWSPKDVFEAAYIPIKAAHGADFSLAINKLKQGLRMRRRGWNGKGIFIELQRPDEHSKMTSPYIYIDSTGLQTDNLDCPKNRVPWLASQTDMLADDWEEVK